MEITRLNIEGAKPAPLSQAEINQQVALLAALAAFAVSLVARFIVGAPLLPELLADFIFAVLPISLIEFGVSLLGPFAKHLAFAGCVALYLVALTGAGILCLRRRGRGRWTNGVLMVLAAWALTMFAIVPLLGGGFLGRELRQGPTVWSAWMLAVYIVLAAALELFSRLHEKEQPADSVLGRALFSNSGQGIIGRRRALRWMGYAVVGVAVYDIGRALLIPWLKSGSGRVSKGSGVFPELDGLALEVTPTGDFYEVSKNTADPDVDVKRWKLEIGGEVETQVWFTYDELKLLPSVQQYATLECISNGVGGDLIGNASWRGVRLKDLLDRAVLKSDTVDIVLRASDGYADSIPVDQAMAEGVILAYEMNGAPLNQTHGFPLRLIVPGIYGMKNVKWITRIEAVSYDFKGYWQARGWDDRAIYKTMSRIDAPRKAAPGQVAIAGIAFAGDRSISKVEVSTDGGKTWELAQIRPALSPYSWVLWHSEWEASAGSHSLVVRATDGKGVVQTSQRVPPIPDGASGYDSRSVQIG